MIQVTEPNRVSLSTQTKPGWSTVTAWLNSLPSDKTKKTYRLVFDFFWSYASENHLKGYTYQDNGNGARSVDSPDALVRHRYPEYKLNDDDSESSHCEKMVEAWHNVLLKNKKMADRSARGYVAVVMSFFKHATRNKASLELQINYRNRRVRINYVPTQQDLVKLRRYCNPRHWALIASMKDSGFGPDQLSHIKWGQVIRDLDHGDFWFVSGQREKTDELFATFFGPDAVNAIKAAYGDANHDGNAPVFVGEYGTYTAKGISKSIKESIVRAGFGEDDRTKNFSAYSLRAFFNTQMETARVPDNWRKSMMGHSLGQTQGAYSRPHVETLLETYKVAYKHLTIESGNGQQGMSPDDIAEMMHIFTTKDPVAFAKFVEKHGEQNPVSKLLKRQISASEAAAM
jgi:integrase